MPNIPSYEQWAKMNQYLNSIAVNLGSDVDVSTWAGVQKAVRLGIAPVLFPIGSQLKVNHSVYGEHLYDVVAHDYFKSAKNENAHTMTIMCHNSVDSLSFDGTEAFYCAETGLTAGTYHFTLESDYADWKAGAYQFTLKNDVPLGGHLVLPSSPAILLEGRAVRSYASAVDDRTLEQTTITLGNGGTNLGAFGVELNHPDRVLNGSNNYKESALRQFLNSTESAGSVWVPQTKFDRQHDSLFAKDGFMKGLDEDFLSVVGEVIVPCTANSIYESPDSDVVVGEKYTLRDRFYVASVREIFGDTIASAEDGSSLFPYYKYAVNVDRVKRIDDVSGTCNYWTRTPAYANAKKIHFVGQDGEGYTTSAPTSTPRVVPVCTIV